MVKIKILAVGKLSEAFYREAQNEFTKRLSRYCNITVTELDDEKTPQNASEAVRKQILRAEGERILGRIGAQDYLIALDLRGKKPDSLQFARQMEQIMLTNSSVCFAIGGSLGLSEEVLARANARICLSEMTFTHNLARIILLEQLYRSFKLQSGEPYHK